MGAHEDARRRAGRPLKGAVQDVARGIIGHWRLRALEADGYAVVSQAELDELRVIRRDVEQALAMIGTVPDDATALVNALVLSIATAERPGDVSRWIADGGAKEEDGDG